MKRLLLLLWLSPLPLFAASYYVTQSGSGSANGTSGNPWSVSSYNASTAPTGGDTVYFSGTITSTISPGHGGTGTGASRLTLDFSACTLGSSSGTSNYVSGNGKSHILYTGGGTFSGATFTPGGTLTPNGTNGGPSPASNGAGLSGPTIFYINSGETDVEISGFYYSGGATDAGLFFQSHNSTFVTVDNNYIDGLSFAWGDTTSIHDLTISGNFARTSKNTWTQTDLISFGDAYNVTIAGNVLINQAPNNQNFPTGNADHNDVIQVYEKGGGGAGNPYNWTVKYNWIVSDPQPTSDGSGEWFEWENMQSSGGYAAAYVYGNVFLSPSDNQGQNNGFAIDGNVSTAVFDIYNNTIISNSANPAADHFNIPNPSGVVFNLYNNAVMAANGNFSSGHSFLVSYSSDTLNTDYNYIANVGSGSSQTTFAGSHGSNAGTAVSNALWFTTLVGTAGGQLPSNYDFSTAGGSSLRAAGTTLGSPYDQGIAFGATWPNPALVSRSAGYDVGAYQYGGADTTPPTAAITTPTGSGAYTASATPLTTLAGPAADNVGLTSVTWTNSLGGTGTATGTTAWSIPSITLSTGANIITITAHDAAGNTGTAVITISYGASTPNPRRLGVIPGGGF